MKEAVDALLAAIGGEGDLMGAFTLLVKAILDIILSVFKADA